MSGSWVPDPWGRYPFRWFDGTNWSALVYDGSTQYLDPFTTSIRPGSPTDSATPPATSSGSPTAPVMPHATSFPAPAEHARPTSPSAAAVGAGSITTTSAPPRPDTSPSAGSAQIPRRADPDGVIATATTSSTAADLTIRDIVAGPSTAEPQRSRRPIWVPAVGIVMVVVAAWWMYGLRGGDDATTSSAGDAADASEVTTLDEAAPPSVATTTTPETVPRTSAEMASSPPPIDPAAAGALQDCIEFVPVAAFSQDPGAQEIWAAAGSDATGLPAACAALPAERLVEIAQQRDEFELASTGSTSPPATAVPTTTVAPPPTAPDASTVPVSPTMPPPLTTAP